jgi:hypothetical protein
MECTDEPGGTFPAEDAKHPREGAVKYEIRLFSSLLQTDGCEPTVHMWAGIYYRFENSQVRKIYLLDE